MKVTIYRGQPITDKDGNPTGKRRPIQTEENYYVKRGIREVEAAAGRRLTKAERKVLRKRVVQAVAAKALHEGRE